jgi:prepilin-type N-terminal cleavage/methylation domain-containing protein
MRRRSGVTLLEVLVAIFVMAIGLLALLVLFPLGALRMYKALQDQRCAEAGASAQAVAVMRNVANDSGLYNPSDPFLNPLVAKLATVLDATANLPSYPVLIDPIGWVNTGGGSTNLGGTGSSVVARRSVSFCPTLLPANQWFTVPDDIDFENAVPGAGNSTAGSPRIVLPSPPAVPQFTRDTRYSFAYLCQRPRYGDPTVVDTSVVVFNKRSLGSASLGEYVYSSTNNVVNVNNNTVVIDYSANVPPPLRVGDWILDATPILDAKGNATTAHGFFYRLVGVTDIGNSQLEVELETPVRGTFPLNANSQPYATIIVLEGVAEVYEKGPARAP